MSVPAAGSVTAIDWMRTLPAAMPGRYFSFWALLPWRSSVPMLYIWPCTAPALPPQRLISSMITVAAVRPRPVPPYSSGIMAASQPASIKASTNFSG